MHHRAHQPWIQLKEEKTVKRLVYLLIHLLKAVMNELTIFIQHLYL